MELSIITMSIVGSLKKNVRQFAEVLGNIEAINPYCLADTLELTGLAVPSEKLCFEKKALHQAGTSSCS